MPRISQLFSTLGAPFVNVRWSWGSVRASDSAVFLRVWQDSVHRREEGTFVRVGSEAMLRADPSKPGRRERMKHIRLIAAGARCFMIMCEAIDPKAAKRQIKDFNRDEVFPGGKVIEVDGVWMIQLMPPVSVNDAKQ